MKLYESKEQMEAWDFIENKKIDIIEEEASINQEVAYICPKCQEKYKEKADFFIKKQCKKCRKHNKSIFYYRSGKWKQKFYIQEFLNHFLIIIFSIFASMISFELETFDLQFGYMTVCYIVFLSGSCMLLRQYLQMRLLKNPNYQRYCLTTFLLLKQEDVFSLYTQINLSLAGLIKPYFPNNYSNEDIVYMLKTDNSLQNRRRLRCWKKRIQNDVYYNEIVSDYETKSMINFKSEGRILNTALEFLITFIGIFLTVVNYINNWERFGWKSFTVFAVLAVLFFVVIIPLNQWHKENKVEETRMRLVVISSAIAKKYNQSSEMHNEVNNNG